MQIETAPGHGTSVFVRIPLSHSLLKEETP